VADHKFPLLEGADGAGKTTLRKLLFQTLQKQGQEILVSTPFGWRDVEAAETIVEAKFHAIPMENARITAAYVRDKEVISDRILRVHLPHRPVLCDRFAPSDLVYHKLLWDISPTDTYQAYCRSRVRMPDHVFFVDTPPEVSFQRLVARGTGGKSRWDYLDKQKRLYELYQEVLFSGRFPLLGQVHRIDNSGDRSSAAGAWLQQATAVLGIQFDRPAQRSSSC